MKGTDFQIGDRVQQPGATKMRRGEVVGIMRGTMSDGVSAFHISKVWVKWDGTSTLEFAAASLLQREPKKVRDAKKTGGGH